ncbi:hypothetical protein E2C01_090392 [Portunus trituberculatus]|uniref:Uncharacterized protein n=1 Tax=Portunus trituberculatus TaxID=210409 RepID=A0A5B7JL97_PORTR|nr:hypothetical protein [Portunus trituberculatus]
MNVLKEDVCGNSFTSCVVFSSLKATHITLVKSTMEHAKADRCGAVRCGAMKCNAMRCGVV